MFSTTVKPAFLGTAWTGLAHWLSKMGLMISLFKSLRIFVFTASCIMGLSLHCGSLLGVASSFKCIGVAQSLDDRGKIAHEKYMFSNHELKVRALASSILLL